MIYKSVLCILLCWFCRSTNRIIVSLFRMLLYVGVHLASNRMYVPHLVTLRDVVIHVYILHWRHFLYEMDIWLKTRSYRKKKAGQSELDLCKLKLYVVIFHTQILTRIDRERLYRISWKLVALQHIFVFIISPPLDDGGIQFYRPFVKKWFPCNNIKTPQHNHFKITCLEMF
jgi:hypothetical protein